MAQAAEPTRFPSRLTGMAPLPRPVAVLSLLVLTACAPATDDALGTSPYPPDALVVQVVRSGGFLPIEHAFGSLPSVSVYGDGRVVRPGAQAAIHPGPALPSVQSGRLEPEQVQQLVEDGRAAVRDGEDYGEPPVADAPTTVVTVQGGDDRATAVARALDALPGGPEPGVTAQQQSARERLSAYVRQVEQAADEAVSEPYRATRLAVLALPFASLPGSESPAPEPVPWPGPPLEAQPGGAPGCVVVGEQVRAAAAEATSETAWADGGRLWRLAFRPLLPHERTCEDALAAAAPPGP